MLSLYVSVCARLGDAYLNFEWLLKLSELISKTHTHTLSMYL